MGETPVASDRSELTSIIIPCYILPNKDAELLTFLKRCIESIRCYTKDYELILVDNGSPIGGEYMRDEADIYVRNQSNLGFAPAVNQGLKLARGEWLVVMNDDIELIDDWLAMAREAWKETTGVICSHLLAHDPECKVGRMVASWGYFFGALWMTRREIVDEVGYLDEGYERGMFEDRDFVLRILQTGREMVKVGHCIHIGNATWGKLPNQKEIYLRNKERFEAKWSKV